MNSSGNITGTPLLQIQGITGTHAATASSSEALVQALQVTDGTVVRGTASGRSPQGATLIQTSVGELSIQTDIFIRRGTEVAIQLERRQNDMFGRLISIDGKSVPKYLEQLAQQQPSGDDQVQTSQLSTASKAGATPSAAMYLPEEIIPARAEAVLLSKPAPMPLSTEPSAMPAASLAPGNASAAMAEAEWPLPLPPALQSSFSQASSGARVALDILGVTFPSSTVAPSSPPSPAAPTSAPLPPSTSTLATPAVSTTAPAIAADTAPPPSKMAPSASASPTPASLPTSHQTSGLAAYQRASYASLSATSPLTSPTIAGTVSTPAVLAAPPTTQNTVATTSDLIAPSPGQMAIPAQASPSSATLTPFNSSSVTPHASLINGSQSPFPVTAHPPSPTGPVFSAMVLGQTGPQELILQTPLGSLKLMNMTPLPSGTQLQMRVTQILPPSLPETGEALLRLTQGFYVPLEGVEALAALTSNLVRQPHQGGLVPAPGKHLMSDALFLLAALKGGDLKRWIGEAKQNDSEIISHDLLKRLNVDFSTLRSSTVEAREPQGWNLVTLPFHTGGQVEPIRLFFKRQRKEPARLNPGDSEHFLVDLVLAQCGRFQLDGMVKKDRNLHFDLMVRTEQPLLPNVEQDIRQIYQNAAEVTGFQGTIGFRSGSKACLQPPVASPDAAGAGEHSIVV